MRFHFFLIFFLLIINSPIIAQTVISGTVIDDKTNEPIPGVNVYIAGTTIGSSTDRNGAFDFRTDLVGRQDIVASFIGYITKVKSTQLGAKNRLELSFSIEADILQLGEIQVVGSNNIFLKQLDLFKTFFIGFDSYADQTILQNSDVLDFEENADGTKITVKSSSPLIIENNALGYTYEIELKQAYFNPNDNTGFYKVYPRVIKMVAPNRRTERRWKSNRNTSYRGSSRHFFKSLIEEKLRQNRFKVYPNDQIFVNYSDSLQHLKRWYPNNWEFSSQNYHIFKLNSEAIRIDYLQSRNSNINQVAGYTKMSSIQIKGFPAVLIVNDAGILQNSERVALYGDWNDRRFSNFLPLDYSN